MGYFHAYSNLKENIKYVLMQLKFYPWSKCCFPLSLGMAIYNNGLKQMKKKKSMDKEYN